MLNLADFVFDFVSCYAEKLKQYTSNLHCFAINILYHVTQTNCNNIPAIFFLTNIKNIHLPIYEWINHNFVIVTKIVISYIIVTAIGLNCNTFLQGSLFRFCYCFWGLKVLLLQRTSGAVIKVLYQCPILQRDIKYQSALLFSLYAKGQKR